MTLGEILKMAAEKDPAGKDAQLGIVYREWNENGYFKIKLSCKIESATVEIAIPSDGLEATKNYARLQFISMLFNSALIHQQIKKYKGQKRQKNK